jgi:hypothetical protein
MAVGVTLTTTIVVLTLVLITGLIVLAILVARKNSENAGTAGNSSGNGNPGKWSNNQKGIANKALLKNIQKAGGDNFKPSLAHIVSSYLDNWPKLKKEFMVAVKCLVESMAKKYSFSYVNQQLLKDVIDVGFKRDLETFSEPCGVNSVVKKLVSGLRGIARKCTNPEKYKSCLNMVRFSDKSSALSNSEMDAVATCFNDNCTTGKASEYLKPIKRREGSPKKWKDCQRKIIKESLVSILWHGLKRNIKGAVDSRMHGEISKVADCMVDNLSTRHSYDVVANNITNIRYDELAKMYECLGPYDVYQRDHDSYTGLEQDCGYNRVLILADYISQFLHNCTNYYQPTYQGQCSMNQAKSYTDCMFKNFPQKMNTNAAENVNWKCTRRNCADCAKP